MDLPNGDSAREEEEERVPVSSRSSPPVSPRSSRSSPPVSPRSSRRRLVLHIDLNNTVLVSDSVTGQGTEAALDGYLPGVTWGRVHKGQWEWLSDRPSLLPPCGGAVSYFSQFGRTPAFTSSSTGRRFRAVLEEHLELLRWPPDARPDPDLSVLGEDGRRYHWLLPSFFQLLVDLTSEGVDFAVVFRTFGTDLPRVLRAVSRALREGHPLFHELPQMFVDETPGRIRCSRKGVVLSRGPERVTSAGDGGARRLYSCLSAAHGIQGYRDHFDWWAGHSFSLTGGKPLWIDPFDPEVQHIFIDDNIRLSDGDTIVHPLVFSSPGGALARFRLLLGALRRGPGPDRPPPGHLRPALLHPQSARVRGQLPAQPAARGGVGPEGTVAAAAGGGAAREPPRMTS